MSLLNKVGYFKCPFSLFFFLALRPALREEETKSETRENLR